MLICSCGCCTYIFGILLNIQQLNSCLGVFICCCCVRCQRLQQLKKVAVDIEKLNDFGFFRELSTDSSFWAVDTGHSLELIEMIRDLLCKKLRVNGWVCSSKWSSGGCNVGMGSMV